MYYFNYNIVWKTSTYKQIQKLSVLHSSLTGAEHKTLGKFIYEVIWYGSKERKP